MAGHQVRNRFHALFRPYMPKSPRCRKPAQDQREEPQWVGSDREECRAVRCCGRWARRRSPRPPRGAWRRAGVGVGGLVLARPRVSGRRHPAGGVQRALRRVQQVQAEGEDQGPRHRRRDLGQLRQHRLHPDHAAARSPTSSRSPPRASGCSPPRVSWNPSTRTWTGTRRSSRTTSPTPTPS